MPVADQVAFLQKAFTRIRYEILGGMPRSYKWVSNSEGGESREIAVTADEFADSVLQAERGDMGIVNKVARDAGFFQCPHHHVRMIGGLGKQNQRGRLQNTA